MGDKRWGNCGLGLKDLFLQSASGEFEAASLYCCAASCSKYLSREPKLTQAPERPTKTLKSQFPRRDFTSKHCITATPGQPACKLQRRRGAPCKLQCPLVSWWKQDSDSGKYQIPTLRIFQLSDMGSKILNPEFLNTLTISLTDRLPKNP